MSFGLLSLYLVQQTNENAVHDLTTAANFDDPFCQGVCRPRLVSQHTSTDGAQQNDSCGLLASVR